MTPTSLPTVQPQPDLEQYPINRLFLFREYTRETYMAAFGVEPPPFALALRPKSWFDSSVDLRDPEAEVEYTVVRALPDGLGLTVRTIHMTARDAASVNLSPGWTTVDPAESAARARPAWEVPIRPLLANELLVRITAGLPGVLRVDKRMESDETAGKFLPRDRAMLERIAAALKV